MTTDETHYAFPHKFQSSPNETTVCFGMTLRDYFAAKAMLKRDWSYFVGDEEMRRSLQRDAKRSYEIADAMLKAREL